MGQLPEGTVSLIETVEDAALYQPLDAENLGFVTQTTLSVDDTAGVIAKLQERFPAMQAPAADSICYATTNRQDAVKKIAPEVDAVLVVGSPKSSNSQRLKEVAERNGARSQLVPRAADIDWSIFGNIKSLGVTAGASAPEILVEEVLDAFAARYTISVETVSTADESVFFPLPKELRERAPQPA